MKNKTNPRRDFLKKTLLASASTIPFMGLLGSISKLEAAETSDEYKALVCVVLHGGADTFNMIIPTDDATYEEYEKARSAIAVSQLEALEFSHRNENSLNPASYGFRPEMSGMKNLFDSGKLAIIANVGTLREPMTRADIENPSKHPSQLFGHNTQLNQWMYGDSKNPQNRGVGGRIADIFYPNGNPYFNVSILHNYLFQDGAINAPLRFNSAKVDPNLMTTWGFGPETGGGELGSAHYETVKNGMKKENKLEKTFSERRMNAFKLQEDMQGLFDEAMDFEGFNQYVGISNQLSIVAKTLSVRDSFPGAKKRQIFMVKMGGWDSHNFENGAKCQELSDAMAAFHSALERMGISGNVTTFTMSEFGRKVSSNGGGTDHGWGSHCFVMGGGVKGGDIHGIMPAIKQDSPDAWSDRIIPTMSVEEYMAPIVKWFGATDSELNEIFQNLKSFPQTLNKFMS